MGKGIQCNKFGAQTSENIKTEYLDIAREAFASPNLMNESSNRINVILLIAVELLPPILPFE